MVYHFREQGFPVSRKAVVTQKRGWLWYFSCSVPVGGILFHSNFVASLTNVCPPSLMNGRAAFSSPEHELIFTFSPTSVIYSANFVSPIAYPPFSDDFEANQTGRWLLKLQLYWPLDVITWTSLMLSVYKTEFSTPPPPQPTRSVSPASPFTQLTH